MFKKITFQHFTLSLGFVMGLVVIVLGAMFLWATMNKEPETNAVNCSVVEGGSITLKPADCLMVGETKITLQAINDSRCPADVQCIWAGELGATFVTAVSGQAPEEIYLGQVTAPFKILGTIDNNLALKILEMTTDQVTVEVMRPLSSSQ